MGDLIDGYDDVDKFFCKYFFFNSVIAVSIYSTSYSRIRLYWLIDTVDVIMLLARFISASDRISNHHDIETFFDSLI